VVSTKSPKTDKQYVWEADADSSSYVIKEETDPEKLITRGTQITLFLRVSSSDCYEVDNILWQKAHLLFYLRSLMISMSLLTLQGFKA
jgi:HSP90 family molecular chaperone